MNDKASAIVRLAQEHLGDPYVYGAWGSPCTPELRRKYARINPSHAGNIKKKCQVQARVRWRMTAVDSRTGC